MIPSIFTRCALGSTFEHLRFVVGKRESNLVFVPEVVPDTQAVDDILQDGIGTKPGVISVLDVQGLTPDVHRLGLDSPAEMRLRLHDLHIEAAIHELHRRRHTRDAPSYDQHAPLLVFGELEGRVYFAGLDNARDQGVEYRRRAGPVQRAQELLRGLGEAVLLGPRSSLDAWDRARADDLSAEVERRSPGGEGRDRAEFRSPSSRRRT